MKTVSACLPLLLLGLIAGGPVGAADTEPEKSPWLTPAVRPDTAAEPVSVDVSRYAVTPELFRSAASRALLGRGWRIETNEATRFQASLVKRGLEYKVEIRLQPQKIVIGFVPGFHADRQNWLRNLEKDILVELQVQSLQKPQ